MKFHFFDMVNGILSYLYMLSFDIKIPYVLQQRLIDIEA